MIMLLDGLKIRILSKCVFRIQISCICPQVRIIPEHFPVYAKTVKVCHVKPCQRDVKTHVRFRNVITEEEPLPREPLLQNVKGIEYQMIRLGISVLTCCESRLVNTVIYVMEYVCV